MLSREQILSAVWGYSHDPGTNIVEVYVSYLRRKLAPARLAGADRHGALGRLPARAEPCVVARAAPRLAALARLHGPRSLRWRLTLAVGARAGARLRHDDAVVYRETESRLRAQIDTDLHTAVERLRGRRRRLRDRADASRGARSDYVDDAAVLAPRRAALRASIGGRVYTNEPELLDVRPRPRPPATAPRARGSRPRERCEPRRPASPTLHRRRRAAAAPRAARRARRLRGATIGVGEPLAPVDDALDGVVARLRDRRLDHARARARARLRCWPRGSPRPLRRMARIAARVDAGDLSPRIDAAGPRDEMRILADAFDHMLDRLEDAFARQQASSPTPRTSCARR